MKNRFSNTVSILLLCISILQIALFSACGDSQDFKPLETEKKSDPAADYAAAQKLAGIWLRSDGPYKIAISEIRSDGSLLAKYFNPRPINVSISNWQIENGILKLFVELRDINYPGSTYTLYYNEWYNSLEGEYFQAAQKSIYVVNFIKE